MSRFKIFEFFEFNLNSSYLDVLNCAFFIFFSLFNLKQRTAKKYSK